MGPELFACRYYIRLTTTHIHITHKPTTATTINAHISPSHSPNPLVGISGWAASCIFGVGLGLEGVGAWRIGLDILFSDFNFTFYYYCHCYRLVYSRKRIFSFFCLDMISWKEESRLGWVAWMEEISGFRMNNDELNERGYKSS